MSYPARAEGLVNRMNLEKRLSHFGWKNIPDGRELILNNNSFQLDNKKYIKTQETTFGTKMAPTYPTLTEAHLKENRYEIIRIYRCKSHINNIKTDFSQS